jgi:hypothetical protein
VHPYLSTVLATSYVWRYSQATLMVLDQILPQCMQSGLNRCLAVLEGIKGEDKDETSHFSSPQAVSAAGEKNKVPQTGGPDRPNA